MTRRLWLAVLALALMAPAALASAPRGASQLELVPPSLSLERALESDEPSGFALGLASLDATPQRFAPLAGVELVEDLAQDLRQAEPSYPKTRIGGLRLFGQDLYVVSTSLSVEVRWGCGDFSCGIAEGDGVNLYAFVGHRPHEKTDPTGLLEEAAFYAGMYMAGASKEEVQQHIDLDRQSMVNAAKGQLAIIGAVNGAGWARAAWAAFRTEWLIGSGLTIQQWVRSNWWNGNIPNAGTTVAELSNPGPTPLRPPVPARVAEEELKAEVKLLGASRSTRALAPASQGRVNNVVGNEFEDLVREGLGGEAAGFAKNEVALVGQTKKGPVATVPDIFDPARPARTGVTDIKNEVGLSFDEQLQAQANIAQRLHVPFNLIISPRTETISKPLQRAVRLSGGTIKRFDPVKKAFSEVRFDPLKPHVVVQ